MDGGPDGGDDDDELTARARIRIGRTLQNKWTLTRLLGVGGLASVYAAQHRNGSRAALKLLHPELSYDPIIKARFLREGYVANAVGHPGTVAVIDDDQCDDGVYLVMELLEGETLEGRVLRLGRIAPAEALALAYPLLDVLSAAHDKKVLHRDIKPANLFLTSSGVLKVLDFGIAQLRDPSAARTQTGVAMGTPGYMAPEQARGYWDQVDARTDVFAVGATLYTLLTGQVLHEAPTTSERLMAAMTEPAPPLRSVLPSVPEPVARVVDAALRFAPEERFTSAATMRAAVAEAHLALTGRLPESPPVGTPVAVATSPRTLTPVVQPARLPPRPGPSVALPASGSLPEVSGSSIPGGARRSWVLPAVLGAVTLLLVVTLGIVVMVAWQRRLAAALPTLVSPPASAPPSSAAPPRAIGVPPSPALGPAEPASVHAPPPPAAPIDKRVHRPAHSEPPRALPSLPPGAGEPAPHAAPTAPAPIPTPSTDDELLDRRR